MDQSRSVSAAQPALRPAGPAAATTQVVPDHIFLYIKQGEVRAYDGKKSYLLKAGHYYLIQKNRLVRYSPPKDGVALEKTIVCFDEFFLKSFQKSHQPSSAKFKLLDTFVRVPPYHGDLGSGFWKWKDMPYSGGLNIPRYAGKFLGIKLDLGHTHRRLPNEENTC